MRPIGQRNLLALAVGLMILWLAGLRYAHAEQVAEFPDSASKSGGRRLNNLVTELLNVSNAKVRGQWEWKFTNPRDGWAFVSSTAKNEAGGKLSMTVEAVFSRPGSAELQPGSHVAPLALVHERHGAETQEQMRFLEAGEYRVRVRSDRPVTVRRLLVRAIPELGFCKFQYDPFITAHGPYDWAFVQKYIASNANCIVGSGLTEHGQFVRSWKQQGKRWIVECGVPALDGKQPLTAEEAYSYWTQNVGFADALLDGVVADEFLGNRRGMKYPEWTEAVRRIAAADTYRGKLFYPYCTAIYRDPVSAGFIRTVMQSGYPFAWEVYLQEQRDEEAARRYLQNKLAAEMNRWRTALTNCEKHMVMCFGYMSLPTTETLNMNPMVDFKVWMDMQFQHVAIDPAFDGLYGLMEYTCGYADEETVRWAARLYRHYGIEGNTSLLSASLGFHYRLDHIQNADFADGSNDWVAQPAEQGSVEMRSMKGYGWLQGRYPRTALGDTFLWTKRSSRTPNLVSQEIKNLRPGQLYSLKMVTADYQELQQGSSSAQKHALGIQLDGVAMLPEKSIQQVIANNYAHELGPFKEQNKAWMNYHFRLFRASGQSAKLTLSDWAKSDAPGGPEGQELMFNFIEVQPYFEE
jgi:hypothetical protein